MVDTALPYEKFINSLSDSDREFAAKVINFLREMVKASGINSLSCDALKDFHLTIENESGISRQCINNISVVSDSDRVFFSTLSSYNYFYTYPEKGKPIRYLKNYSSSKHCMDISLIDYLENDYVKEFVDRTMEKLFPPDSVELFKSIASEHYPIPLSINTILNPLNKTKIDVLTNRGKYKLPFDADRYPFAYGLMLRELSKLFPKECISKFYKKDNTLLCLNELSSKSHSTLWSLAMTGAGKVIYPGIDYHVINTYLGICKRVKIEPHWHIRSERKMIERIYELRHEYEGEKLKEIDLKPAAVFRSLEKKLNGEYTLLKTSAEMIDEGKRQNNCVSTYIYAVNKRSCGIFTCDRDNTHYTIEVNYNRICGYSCNQFLGPHNSSDERCKQQKKIFCSKLEEINKELTSGKNTASSAFKEQLSQFQLEKLHEAAAQMNDEITGRYGHDGVPF